MEIMQVIDSKLKLKSWVKQVLAVGGMLGFCFLVLYAWCYMFTVS
ncbi:hypothetical protein ACT1UG_26915 [Bacillus paramycoides]